MLGLLTVHRVFDIRWSSVVRRTLLKYSYTVRAVVKIKGRASVEYQGTMVLCLLLKVKRRVLFYLELGFPVMAPLHN